MSGLIPESGSGERPRSGGVATGSEGLRSFLNGGVRIRTLPVLSAPFPQDAPLLKRLLLPQGELAQVHDAEEPIRYLAFIEMRAGTTRGNHYHLGKEESVYLVQGELSLVVEDPSSLQRETIVLVAGELATIRTGIAHALVVKTAGQAIEFSPARFDPADTYRHPVT